MTMSGVILEALEARGLDVETASRLGLASRAGAGSEGRDALVIPFVREGEVVRRKLRTLTGKKWFNADPGGLRIAFNEDCLRDATLAGQPLIITEGELDAVAAIQAGFPRTMSVPDGAPSKPVAEAADSKAYAWLEDIRPLLNKDNVPEVILATDADEPGAALLHDLSVLIGRYRCKFLTYPKRRDGTRCKDLNEVLQAYGSKGVVETINRAAWLKIDGVYRMGELPPLPNMVIFESPRHQLFNENFKLRLGDFSVFTGTPGFGKTSFVNDYLCSLVAAHGLIVAWASFEQEPQRDHRRNLRNWLVDDLEGSYAERVAVADRWIDAHHLFLIPSEDEDADLDWLLEKMELAAQRFGAKVFVIDPWNELEHCRRRDETETEYIGRAIRRLKRFAKAFQVHVCVIAHPTKSVKDQDGSYKMPTLYDIAGSANWYNKSDLGVIIHREDEENTLVKVQKSRYHDTIGKPGEVRMHYCVERRRFTETERANAG